MLSFYRGSRGRIRVQPYGCGSDLVKVPMVTQAFSIRKVLEVVKVGLIVIAEVARAAVVKETELAMIC